MRMNMTSSLSHMTRNLGAWLQDGPESDVIVSSRIRLARNLSNVPFVNNLTTSARDELFKTIRAKLTAEEIVKEATFFDIGELSEIDRTFLVERHLISTNLCESSTSAGALITADNRVSIMINEEDHLRIQVLGSGFAVDDTYQTINELDNTLSEIFDFAWQAPYGYLSACPTNTGTGMRTSLMLHLPALTLSGKIQRVIDSVAKVGLTIRGFFGEGTKAVGHFYQVSNQITLGMSELALVNDMQAIVPQITRYEKEAREAMSAPENRIKLEDKIWRDVGLLQSARTITSTEALNALSSLRLGVHLGMIREIDTLALNYLLVYSQPAHLQRLYSRDIATADRDELRAQYIRKALQHIDLSGA